MFRRNKPRRRDLTTLEHATCISLSLLSRITETQLKILSLLLAPVNVYMRPQKPNLLLQSIAFVADLKNHSFSFVFFLPQIFFSHFVERATFSFRF